MPNLDKTLANFKISKQTGNRYQAYCPAHDDKNASMSILVDENRILLYCHAGCQIDDILKAVGITYADLFADNPPTNIYQYRDKNGNLAYEKLKYKTPKGKTFRQRRVEQENGKYHIEDNLEGVARIPYNLPKLKDAITNRQYILLVEGEKDANTAGLLGYIGTTFGGASDWKDEYKNYFRGGYVVIIPDKDDPGIKNAKKIQDSLCEVCKSLKVVILPEGKDLTEWVEAGNSDILPLIKSSKETVITRDIPEPTMEHLPTGYSFDWNGMGLKIIIDRMKGDDEGEIAIYNNHNDVPDYISGIKLLSISHKQGLTRALKPIRNLEWEKIINQITTKTLTAIRQGNEVEILNPMVDVKKPEYLLYPLFIKNAPNIIYADRSSGKSLFLTMIDILLSFPDWGDAIGLPQNTNKITNALFCDWENDSGITKWQMAQLIRGTGMTEYFDMLYLRCNRPLIDSVDHILSKIAETKSEVIIIDSLGMAVGDDLNLTKPAFAFFNSLRQLPVTPIIIGHTSKDINNKRKTVYGNAYYENEARSVWEIDKYQEIGSNEMVVTLNHRKSPPFTNLHEPMAWKYIFEDNKTFVESTIPEIDKRISAEKEPTENDIALEILMNTGLPMTPNEILKASNGKIKSTNIWEVCKRLVKKDLALKNSDGKYVYKDN
jgi:hypothetical protein